MSAMNLTIGILVTTALAGSLAAEARAQQPPMPTPATAAAEVTQCQQAQMVVDQLLATSLARVDAARQSNAAADLRAAVDSLQTTLRDARAQLVPCASIPVAAGAHAGHNMPPQTPAPAAVAPPGDPHAGHVMPAPTTKPAPVKPTAPARAPTPAAPPTDPHAGHVMPPATTSKPAPAKGAKPPAAAKPPAPMDHSTMDHSKEAAAAVKAPPPGAPTEVVDPVCGMKVDPAAAPDAQHQGKTYHFCSEQHRDLFQKTPTKYLPKGE